MEALTVFLIVDNNLELSHTACLHIMGVVVEVVVEVAAREAVQAGGGTVMVAMGKDIVHTSSLF